MDEALRDHQEDFEDLAAVLQHLGLSDYKSTFDQEQIDVESFVSCSSSVAHPQTYRSLSKPSVLPAPVHRRRPEGDGPPAGPQEENLQVR